MSTRELDDAVREALWLEGPVTRNRRPKRRKPAPTFLKTVRKMGELVDEDGRWHDLRQIGRLKPEEALALFETIRQIEKKCREVRAAQGECCRRAGG
jgi:hypothetical protein